MRGLCARCNQRVQRGNVTWSHHHLLGLQYQRFSSTPSVDLLHSRHAYHGRSIARLLLSSRRSLPLILPPTGTMSTTPTTRRASRPTPGQSALLALAVLARPTIALAVPALVAWLEERPELATPLTGVEHRAWPQSAIVDSMRDGRLMPTACVQCGRACFSAPRGSVRTKAAPTTSYACPLFISPLDHRAHLMPPLEPALPQHLCQRDSARLAALRAGMDGCRPARSVGGACDLPRPAFCRAAGELRGSERYAGGVGMDHHDPVRASQWCIASGELISGEMHRYLLNPYTLATCLARSTVTLDNALVLGAIASAAQGGFARSPPLHGNTLTMSSLLLGSGASESRAVPHGTLPPCTRDRHSAVPGPPSTADPYPHLAHPGPT